jgi:hypothetical protein
MIRPPHPESEASTILELHRKVTERIDRQRTQGPLHEHLEAASADLDEVARVSVIDGTGQTMLAHVVARTLAAAPGGPRAGNLDGNGGSLRTDDEGFVILRSDPTGDAAMQLDDGARDRREMMHQLEAIQRHLTHYSEFPTEHAKVIRRCADRFVCVCLNWLPREARDSERNEASDGEPGCEAHAQLRSRKGPEGAHWWAAIAHAWRGGLLGEPANLCTGCHSFAKRTGRKPNGDEVAHYERVGKWPRMHEAKAS